MMLVVIATTIYTIFSNTTVAKVPTRSFSSHHGVYSKVLKSDILDQYCQFLRMLETQNDTIVNRIESVGTAL
jgi:hypothetical protein